MIKKGSLAAKIRRDMNADGNTAICKDGENPYQKNSPLSAEQNEERDQYDIEYINAAATVAASIAIDQFAIGEDKLTQTVPFGTTGDVKTYVRKDVETTDSTGKTVHEPSVVTRVSFTGKFDNDERKHCLDALTRMIADSI